MEFQCFARAMLVSLLLPATPAMAAEPPAVGIAPGLSCEQAHSAEVAAGARARKPLEQFISEGFSAFDGTLQGEPAIRAYACANGLVSSQMIQLNYATQDAALAAHARLLKLLTRQLGRPCRFPDLLPLRDRRKVLAANPWMHAQMRYVADWPQPDGVKTSLDLKSGGPSAPWQVGVVSGRAPAYACHRF